jgi:hypothetical protein
VRPERLGESLLLRAVDVPVGAHACTDETPVRQAARGDDELTSAGTAGGLHHRYHRLCLLVIGDQRQPAGVGTFRTASQASVGDVRRFHSRATETTPSCENNVQLRRVIP